MPMNKAMIATLILVVFTVASGVMHGKMSGRWGQTKILAASGRKLNSLPTTRIGDWTVVKRSSLSDEVVEMLECSGNTSRVYRNQRTNATLNMFLIVGPHGPTVAHTPDICYSSRDYERQGDAVKKTIVTADGTRHAFWAVTMTSKSDIDPHDLRVLYAWSDGEKWSAAKNPRWDYLGFPRLYKIQLSSRISENKDAKIEPMESFLEDFLPELFKHME